MTFFRNPTTSSSGNIALVALGVVLILALGFGAWTYFKKDIPVIPGEGVQVTETFETENADVAATQAVEVNVAEAMAPRTSGDPNAPVKIIEYASLTCSHCAHFHNEVYPALKAKYIDTGKVFFEYREFPLNDAALKATIAARCLPAERYEGFITMLFNNQRQWAESIDYVSNLRQNAKLAGLSEEQFQACQDNPAIKAKIAEGMQQAQEKWKVSATPTFIINDGAQTISGAQPLENFERAFREVTNGAVGEAPAVE